MFNVIAGQAPEMVGDWRQRGVCARLSVGYVERTFWAFDGEDDRLQEAKALCLGCPVRSTCLDWALESGEDFGVWGGMTAEERRALRNLDLLVPSTPEFGQVAA